MFILNAGKQRVFILLALLFEIKSNLRVIVNIFKTSLIYFSLITWIEGHFFFFFNYCKNEEHEDVPMYVHYLDNDLINRKQNRLKIEIKEEGKKKKRIKVRNISNIPLFPTKDAITFTSYYYLSCSIFKYVVF